MIKPEVLGAIQEVCEMTVETWEGTNDHRVRYECHICRTINTDEEWHKDWCPIKTLREAIREEKAHATDT